MSAIGAQHQSEVDKGERFEFGKNWARFLSRLTAARIELAENSLRTFLQTERLDGKTFLDIGSGSGLFSLAARRLGARVRSFDYDSQSVACTQEMRRRYFENDPDWIIGQGSALDKAFLQTLGQYDIVYSWGVLHHTGAMWQALENVKQLVPVGGQLFIAIYNDQGEATDNWASIKHTYNSLPRPLAYLFALGIISKSEIKSLFSHYRNGTTKDWLRTWTEYHKISTRGMSRWHDWIDWIGGYPYERASIEQIIDVYAKDGFRLTKLADRSTGNGCNEFVFHRDAPAGQVIDTPISGSRMLARRVGRRVSGSFELTESGWSGVVQNPPDVPSKFQLHLLRNDELVGPVTLAPNKKVVVAPTGESRDAIEAAIYCVVAAQELALEPPFTHVRGRMWEKAAPDLTELSDCIGDDMRSPLFVFEGARQLPRPHAIHDDIDRYGGGRFSHWNHSIYFSTLDDSDPNTNKRRYRALICDPTAG